MKVKRTLSALLCSGMFMLSVIPASAESCSHVYVNIRTTVEYRYADPANHEYNEKRIFTCQACREVLRVEESKGIEGHSQGTLADLGHVGRMSHKYKIGCTKCGGGSYEVIVPCADH